MPDESKFQNELVHADGEEKHRRKAEDESGWNLVGGEKKITKVLKETKNMKGAMKREGATVKDDNICTVLNIA